MIKGDFWGGHISLLPIDRELTFSGFLAGKVCEKCNNNWMSDLESKAQRFIYQLIEGRLGLGECNEEEHDTLAKWAFKTSSVLSLSTNAAQNYVLPEHAREFGASLTHELPTGVNVFGHTSKSSDFLWSLSPTWQVYAEGDISENVLSAMHKDSYKIFIQLGHLMLITCYWPAENIKYTKEKIGISIHGEFIFSTEIDSRRYIEKDCEYFLMSIGAYF